MLSDTSRVTLFRLERWLTKALHSFEFLVLRRKSTYRSGLGLGNQVASKNGGLDGTLLNGRGLFETIGVNTAEEFFREIHGVKGLNGFIPVRVNIGIGQAAGRGFVSAMLRRIITVIKRG